MLGKCVHGNLGAARQAAAGSKIQQTRERHASGYGLSYTQLPTINKEPFLSRNQHVQPIRGLARCCMRLINLTRK